VDTEARNWLMRWTLKGRANPLPWDDFVTMPEEIFHFLAEDTPTFRRRHVVSQRCIATGKMPQITLTRFIFQKYVKYEVELWPDVMGQQFHRGQGKPTTRRTAKTFKEAMTEAAKLVQHLETQYHPEPLWKYPDDKSPRMYTHGQLPKDPFGPGGYGP
jgi:hypothetical protein